VAQALQFLDPACNSSPTIKFVNATGIPGLVLPVGDNAQVGDLRIVFVQCMDSGGSSGWSSNSGWNRVTFSSAQYLNPLDAVFWRILPVNPADGLAVGLTSTKPQFDISAVTIRNWDATQTPTFATARVNTNGPAPVNLTVASVSVTAGQVLLCAYFGFNATVYSLPSGMTELAHADNSGSGYTVDPNNDPPAQSGSFLAGQSYSSSTTTGTKTAQIVAPGPEQGIVFSTVLRPAPDQTFAVAAVTETDTPGTITLASTGATSFPVAAVTETDTPGVILFKTQSQWTDWDILPGDPVQNSLLTWTVIPGSAGSTVTVKTSIDGGATWQLAVNGGPIPNLNKGNTTATVVGYQVTETRINAGDTPAQVSDLWPRIAVDDGHDEMLPLGTFVINAQDVVESGGSSGGGAGGSGGAGSSGVAGGGGTTVGGGMVVTLIAPDYSYIISRRTWDDVFFVAGGTNVMDAVALIAVSRMPDVKLNLGSTPHVLQGPMVFGSDQGQNDPWNDLKELVASIGWEIYFNIWGELTTRPMPDPSVDAPVWTISDGSDGNRPTICGYTKTVDDATTFSHVIAQGESTNNPSGLPVMAEWFNIDPASNTNLYSDFGDVTTVYQSVLLGTTVQCQQAADAIGRFSSGTEETLKLDHLPVPFLEQSDLVAVVRPLAGISGTYQINGWTFPLGPNGVQSSDIYRQGDVSPIPSSVPTPLFPRATLYPSPSLYPDGS
jgi:uncharacterized membrane protein YgcG